MSATRLWFACEGQLVAFPVTKRIASRSHLHVSMSPNLVMFRDACARERAVGALQIGNEGMRALYNPLKGIFRV